ncbi:MAG: hypothetical protein BWK78_06975 [Thiotrichaceae bacterium IS1]|nr:MAG: hypothetical protein BWK78_06975 [Thiotrichaceae bacterium IS1]
MFTQHGSTKRADDQSVREWEKFPVQWAGGGGLAKRLMVGFAKLVLLLSIGCFGTLAQADGIITTVAGGGTGIGDGGPATNARLFQPKAVVVDGSGNYYIADSLNHRIRKVATDGTITTVAGNGTGGFSGDGGPATSAQLNVPYDVALDNNGNLYIADLHNQRIRKVAIDGIITTVAGVFSGGVAFSGDNGLATNAQFSLPTGVALDSSGNLYIVDAGNKRIRKVSTNGIITTVAGNGLEGFGGDNGPATDAQLDSPNDIALDSNNNLYIADVWNARIRKVSTNGIITTVAGNGSVGFSGDNGPATSAQFNQPVGVALDSSNNLYIVDFGNARIRKVSTNGIITTVAGNGSHNFSGDGGPATNAQINQSNGVGLDGNGNLYIADVMNSRIRKVTFGPTTTSCNTVTEIPVAECQELLKLYNSTNGPNWTNKTGWNQTNTPCSWIGVTCSGGHVQQLNLPQNQLSGSIHDFNLPNLRSLDLAANQLSGSVPNFSNLPNLTHLYLQVNQLNGSVPNFSNLPNLTTLHLHENQLSGSVPNFSNLPNLRALVLGGNQLSGSIPNFTNLPNLQVLLIFRNQLSGSVPNFSNLPNLQILSLSLNQLSGSIPNFSNFPNLARLLLDSNQLSGSVPNFTSFNLANLLYAHFYRNCGLTAYDAAQEAVLNQKDPEWKNRNPNCPATFNVTVNKTGNGQVSGGGTYATGATVNLTATPDAGYSFSGWSPAVCANSFAMPNNNLTCTASFVPTSFSCNAVTEIPVAECQELLSLYNSTNGPNWTNKTGWNQTNTPCSWFGVSCNGGHIQKIDLSNVGSSSNGYISGNGLKGQIPDLNLPSLVELWLVNNQLSGSIPNFSNLPKLIRLALVANQLSGSIPDFSKLPNLKELWLGSNQLSGSIPNFSNLLNLQSLSLDDNQLSGSIPNFSNLPNLTWLYLNGNQLSGTIPNFSNLPNLTWLYLNGNQLSGTIPNFSNLPKLATLYLNDNYLSGSIPNFTAFVLSSLANAVFHNNCGLTAYDAIQEAVLNSKTLNWNQRNPNCPVVSLTATPATTAICAGSTFDVTIRADKIDTQPADGVEMSLKFDPSQLQVNSVTNSGVLDFELDSTHDNTTGDISFYAITSDNPAQTASFDVMTISFTAIGNAKTTVLDLLDNSKLTNAGETVLASVVDNTLTFSQCLGYQVNLQQTKPRGSWANTDLAISLGTETVAKPYSSTADAFGEGTLTLENAPTNSDYFCVKNSHTLANKIVQTYPKVGNRVGRRC